MRFATLYGEAEDPEALPKFGFAGDGMPLDWLIKLGREHEPFLTFARGQKGLGLLVGSPLSDAAVVCVQARAGTEARDVEVLADGQTLDAALDAEFAGQHASIHRNCDLLHVVLLGQEEPYAFEALVDFPGRLEGSGARWVRGHYPGRGAGDVDVLRVLADQTSVRIGAYNFFLGARLLNFRVPASRAAGAIQIRVSEFSEWQYLFVPMVDGEDIAQRVLAKLRSPQCAISYFTAIPSPE